MFGIEFVDGTRFVRSADGHVYRLLDLTEMQEAQPFPPDSRLAVELSKPNSCRSIMAQPDTLVLDMRSRSRLPNSNFRPIVVVTPENVFLASKLFPLMSIFLIEDVMDAVADCDVAFLSRISPCLTWRERWEVAIYKLSPRTGASLHDIHNGFHSALALAVAPAAGVDGLVPKSLAKCSWSGRLSLNEFFVLLRANPEMLDNLKLVGSMHVEIKFLDEDGETYSSKRLVKFLGGWLFSAIGSDSMVAGKRRLHDPPGTHGYTAIVPMTGRKPFERMRYDVDTGQYTIFAAAARYTAAVRAYSTLTPCITSSPLFPPSHAITLTQYPAQGSYAGGGALKRS